tara:strand:+ start:28527 stop:28739 length:213 start_codon:yes stop_codon:yes gene_type:complete
LFRQYARDAQYLVPGRTKAGHVHHAGAVPNQLSHVKKCLTIRLETVFFLTPVRGEAADQAEEVGGIQCQG